MLISDLQDIKFLILMPVITHVPFFFISEIRVNFTELIMRFFESWKA